MSNLLHTLYRYHGWANAELFEKLALLEQQGRTEELQAALRLVGHHHVVARIFRGHLEGVPHGFSADNFAELPGLPELRDAVTATDAWYLDYVADVPAAALAETIAFSFTDGDRGRMTREEMLAHVLLHAGYHRGEVGRLLWQVGITPPWDTLAVFLHQTEPGRRG